MNETTIQSFWDACRLQIVAFRASGIQTGTPQEKAAAIEATRLRLLSNAQALDPNRRTVPYNLPSILQDQMDEILSKAVYLMNKWVADGCPPNIPNV